VVEELAAVTVRTQQWARSFDRVLVHVDADVLDYDKFPIAENTGRRGGLDLPSLSRLLTVLCRLSSWRALTVTEVNPRHAPDEAESFRQLVTMLGEVLGAPSHDRGGP